MNKTQFFLGWFPHKRFIFYIIQTWLSLCNGWKSSCVPPSKWEIKGVDFWGSEAVARLTWAGNENAQRAMAKNLHREMKTELLMKKIHKDLVIWLWPVLSLCLSLLWIILITIIIIEKKRKSKYQDKAYRLCVVN